MQTLWIHRSMEQLQHLIVRRSCNGIARQEVIASWMAIQREVTAAIDQMDKEYDIITQPQKLNVALLLK